MWTRRFSIARRTVAVALVGIAFLGLAGCGASSTPYWMDRRDPGAPRAAANEASRRESITASDRSFTSRSGGAFADHHTVLAAGKR